MDTEDKKHIIACNRPWCEGMAKKLEKETGERFYFIDDVKNLTSDYLEKIKPYYIFFPHWSHIIPESIYTKYECVIFHMTDLPYGRGGSPLQNLIVRGHEDTKISALRCAGGIDDGPIYFKETLSLLGTAEEIYLRSSKQVEKMICRLIKEKPVPKKQRGSVSSFKRRKPNQGDWSDLKSLEEVFDYIRMLDADGYPSASNILI
jgi:methionyl-tRNA formyltransferase